jgi:hypothetical protein
MIDYTCNRLDSKSNNDIWILNFIFYYISIIYTNNKNEKKTINYLINYKSFWM